MAQQQTQHCGLCQVYVKHMRRHEKTKRHKGKLSIALMRASGKVPLDNVVDATVGTVNKRFNTGYYVPSWFFSDLLRKALPKEALSYAGGRPWCDGDIETVVLYLVKTVLDASQGDIDRARELYAESRNLFEKVRNSIGENVTETLARLVGEDGKLNEEGRALATMAVLSGGGEQNE